jgi:hypothetical protein
MLTKNSALESQHPIVEGIRIDAKDPERIYYWHHLAETLVALGETQEALETALEGLRIAFLEIAGLCCRSVNYQGVIARAGVNTFILIFLNCVRNSHDMTSATSSHHRG